MPSPSKTALFTGLIATAILFVGGACAASFLASPVEDAQRDGGLDQTIPSLTPGGHISAHEMAAASKSGGPSTPEVHASQISSTIEPASEFPAISMEQRDATGKSGLTLNITNVRADGRTVYVLVFSEKTAYTASDYTKAVGYLELLANSSTLNANVPDLPLGRYAVTLFHDQNGDQDLNLDAEGYPSEGYGTSNANSKYDILSFEEAVIESDQHSVEMFYLY